MKDLLGIVGTAQKVLKSIISEKNAERWYLMDHLIEKPTYPQK